ncbi:efflux RND transporter periplasmic adaptor subunit [Enterovirga sp.]|uniref:efflux RND transporter periplasmic adaptor subunit n=1 Tax=Enterovirga sp. TaxID=2026350 RepID=UPI00262216E7|nr:efflux RND transporter periplasmic adaptor subunit [Enterovirga sp.]MDB5592252.1 transporter [Enterovirga sp.]
MIRVLLLAGLAAAAGFLFWKKDEALRFASERAPILAPYLPKPGTVQAGAPGPTRPAPPPVPVVLAKAERRSVPVTVDAVGTVQSMASIAIKPRIDSQIAAISVKEGALVREGDLLVQLDDRALRAQLAQADAMVEKDRAQVQQARRDLARFEELLSKRIGTEVQRDTAATLLRVQQAQLAADMANRDNLATLLTYTVIRAPISGRIGSIALKVGTTVRSADAQAIATINQVDPIYVSFAIPQSLFGSLRTAMAAGRVGIEARVGDWSVPGHVAYLENTVDLATGTIVAKAEMANRDERLWPGAFVAVQATLGVEAEAVAVPSAAVQIGQQGAYVFVVGTDRRAKLTPVTVARTAGTDTVISRGLTGDEQVVVDGQLRLVDGALVQAQQAVPRDGVATGGDPAPPEKRRG